MGKEQRSQIEQEHFASNIMVVKIGSSAITEGATIHEPLNKVLMGSIARQCSEVVKGDTKLALVTSGSVACGRYLLHLNETDIVDGQVESAYGQPWLIKAWIDAFAAHGVKAAQILFSESDLNQAEQVLSRVMEYGVPIINANDSVSDQEMRQFLVSADNDLLAEVVTRSIGADTLLILTDVAGVLDEDGNLIEDGADVDLDALNGKSSVGTGGMRSKVEVAKEVNIYGADGFIGMAKAEDIILKVAKRQTKGICTSFIVNSDL